MEKAERKFSPFMFVLFLVFVIYVAILLGLLFWAIESSFKEKFEFLQSPIGKPEEFVNNYKEAIAHFLYDVPDQYGGGQVKFPFLALNSIGYAVGSAFLQTLAICIVSYCCARYRYKFSKIVYTMVLVLMMTPVIGSTPASIKLSQDLGLYGKMWGIWIMNASFLGLYFLVFHDIFASMPDSFFEAARIDGAGDMSILLKIALPLSTTGFMTIMLVNFITYWNDYQTPLLYLKRNPVLAYQLQIMTEKYDNMPMLMSASIVVLVPVVVLFAFTNKKLMGNLTIGGVKG